jgi:hypothetical protein
VLQIRVPVDEAIRTADPAAVDDARVVELVREHDLAATREPGDRPQVGEIAGAEQQRALVAGELGDSPFQSPVGLHVSGDQP